MTVFHARTAAATVPAASLAGLRQWLRAACDAFRRCNARRRERVELASLGEAALKDIGVSRAQAQFEVEKPCWRP